VSRVSPVFLEALVRKARTAKLVPLARTVQWACAGPRARLAPLVLVALLVSLALLGLLAFVELTVSRAPWVM